MCLACGREGESRETIGDESCFIWGRKVYKDSIKREIDGRVVSEVEVCNDN